MRKCGDSRRAVRGSLFRPRPGWSSTDEQDGDEGTPPPPRTRGTQLCLGHYVPKNRPAGISGYLVAFPGNFRQTALLSVVSAPGRQTAPEP